MGISFGDEVQWAAGTFLEALILFLALRRKLIARQPLFTIYLAFLVANQVAMVIVYWVFGFLSHLAFYIYWVLQFSLILLRGASVYEVCRVILLPFRGVWRVCRTLLLAVGAIIVVTASVAAVRSGPHIGPVILTAKRGLELTIVGTLIFGLAFCRYYHVHVARYLLWIAMGFGIYSAVQIVNDTALEQLFLSYFPLWKQLSFAAFDVASLLWVFALFRPLPARQLAPTMLSPSAYPEMAPVVTSRLRELNSRLLEIWK
jgi:hypothetical protein